MNRWRLPVLILPLLDRSHRQAIVAANHGVVDMVRLQDCTHSEPRCIPLHCSASRPLAQLRRRLQQLPLLAGVIGLLRRVQPGVRPPSPSGACSHTLTPAPRGDDTVGGSPGAAPSTSVSSPRHCRTVRWSHAHALSSPKLSTPSPVMSVTLRLGAHTPLCIPHTAVRQSTGK